MQHLAEGNMITLVNIAIKSGPSNTVKGYRNRQRDSDLSLLMSFDLLGDHQYFKSLVKMVIEMF